MVQTLVPTSTIAAGSWTAVGSGGANLWNVVDETVAAAADGDYDASTTSGDALELKLSAGVDPGAHGGTWKARFRAFRAAATAVDLTCQVRQGSTVIAQQTFALTNAFALYELALSAAEAAAIGDFTDLRLRFIRSSTTTASRISVCEIQLPDPALTTDSPDHVDVGSGSASVLLPATGLTAEVGSGVPRVQLGALGTQAELESAIARFEAGAVEIESSSGSATPSVRAAAAGVAAELATCAAIVLMTAVCVGSSTGAASASVRAVATAHEASIGAAATRVLLHAEGQSVETGTWEEFEIQYMTARDVSACIGTAMPGYRARLIDVPYTVPGQPRHYKHVLDAYWLPWDEREFPNGRPQLPWFLFSGWDSSNQLPDHYITPRFGLAWRMLLQGWVVVPITGTITNITVEDPDLVPSSPIVPGAGAFYPDHGATAVLYNSVENGGLYAMQDRDCLLSIQFIALMGLPGGRMAGLLDIGNSWPFGRSNGAMMAKRAALAPDAAGRDGFHATSSRARGFVIEADAGTSFLSYMQDGTIPGKHFTNGGGVDDPIATQLSQVSEEYQLHASSAFFAIATDEYPDLLDDDGKNINRHVRGFIATNGNWEQYQFGNGTDVETLPFDVLVDGHSGSNSQFERAWMDALGIPMGTVGKCSLLCAPVGTKLPQAWVDLEINDGDSGANDPVVVAMSKWLHVQAFTGWYEATSDTVLGRFKSEVAEALDLATQYDNMLAPETNEATWLEASVTFGETEQVEIGERFAIRRNGELVVTVYVPVVTGDSASWAITDAIESAFAAGTKVDGITFRPMNAQRSGPSTVQGAGTTTGPYWITTIVVPFWGDQALPTGPYATGAATGQQDLEGIAATIRKRFDTRIVQVEEVLAQLDNMPSIAPSSGEHWMQLHILPGPRMQRTTGADGSKIYERRGLAKVQIFAPLNVGLQHSLYLADRIDLFFRTVVDNGVEFGVPQVMPVGRSGAHWQISVTVPWRSFSND